MATYSVHDGYHLIKRLNPDWSEHRFEISPVGQKKEYIPVSRRGKTVNDVARFEWEEIRRAVVSRGKGLFVAFGEMSLEEDKAKPGQVGTVLSCSLSHSD